MKQPLLSLVRNGAESDQRPTVRDLEQRLGDAAEEVRRFALTNGGDFRSFEKELTQLLWALGRVAVTLFLAARQESLTVPPRLMQAGRVFRPAPAQARNLNTSFGVVRYWRTYLREVAKGERHGFYPLDLALGLVGDRISFGLLSIGVRLALKLSFAEARSTLGMFVPTPPSVEVIEKATLGFGHHAEAWIESAPAPEGDGTVMVIQIDSKGAPTATASELARRRGKRRAEKSCCRRHRGKRARHRHGKKPRRKKGDKSKNARLATLAVMYTLERGADGKLHGPINTRCYASFRAKRHTFAIASREAQKRGFGPDSGRRVQLVTDGDNDLAVYAKQYLPHALHSIDVMHVVEKLWTAGESLYKEGTDACREWVEARKDELYAGKATRIVAHLGRRLDETPKTGPGNKGKRERLSAVLRYIRKRLDYIRYDRLIAEGLELGTGAVEGAVKNIIAKRCDHGGMRWIKERVEAIVQLRCIEANGDFSRFADFVAARLNAQSQAQATICRLQVDSLAALSAPCEAA